MALAIVVVVVILVVKVGPKQLANTAGLDRKEQAEEVGRVRTATLALLAGVIAFVGALYTARTYGLNRRGQITDRFIRAVAQLGDGSLDVRVGGVYALERVAHESSKEHGPVMEVLAAFVRQHAPSSAATTVRTPADVLAAMTVLERRNRAFDDPDIELDLSYTNLSYIKLRAGADLRGMTFAHAKLDHAHLHRADLTAVDLQGASLEYARLEHAHLAGSQLLAADLTRALLSGADLREARFAGTTLHRAWLIGADLRGADFRSFNGYDRQGELVSYRPADPGADGSRDAADLSGATYDEKTKWPNLPPNFGFDPTARGALRE